MKASEMQVSMDAGKDAGKDAKGKPKPKPKPKPKGEATVLTNSAAVRSLQTAREARDKGLGEPRPADGK